MKRFSIFAALATVACAVIMSSCDKEEPVPPVITITSQPKAPATLIEGQIPANTTLTVTASVNVSKTLTYQWYSNTLVSSVGGTEIDGETGTSLTLPTDLAEGLYYYYCEIGAQGVTSVCTVTVTVNVELEPVITIDTQPTAPATLTEGKIPANTTLTVAASVSKDVALNYQWYANTSASNTGGTAIDGETGASFTLPTDLAVGDHYYFCVIGTEWAESVRTDPVTVTVVAAPGLVTAAALTGVTAPVGGAIPSTAIDGGTGFTAAISWVNSPVKFEYDTVYSATITLTAATGYTFEGGFADTEAIAAFTVNSIAPDGFLENDGNTLIFTVSFPATTKLVPAGAITGVITPVGGSLNTTAIQNGTGYTAAVEWSPAIETNFAYNTVYTATVTLTAEADYTFENSYANTADIAGFTVNTIVPTWESNNGSVLKFTVTFEKTASDPSDHITYPGGGDTPWKNQP